MATFCGSNGRAGTPCSLDSPRRAGFKSFPRADILSDLLPRPKLEFWADIFASGTTKPVASHGQLFSRKWQEYRGICYHQLRLRSVRN